MSATTTPTPRRALWMWANLDSDGDGTVDCIDECPNNIGKTAPGVCGCETSDFDADGDGTPNCIDNCPNDIDKVEPGNCGCGQPDTVNCEPACPDNSGCALIVILAMSRTQTIATPANVSCQSGTTWTGVNGSGRPQMRIRPRAVENSLWIWRGEYYGIRLAV